MKAMHSRPRILFNVSKRGASILSLDLHFSPFELSSIRLCVILELPGSGVLLGEVCVPVPVPVTAPRPLVGGCISATGATALLVRS